MIDSSAPSPESPLRVTRLLPSLDDSNASKPTHNAGDASKDSDAGAVDPQSVCVTKLLLSCLSEDSADKDQADAGPVHTDEKEASSLNDAPPEPKASAGPHACVLDKEAQEVLPGPPDSANGGADDTNKALAESFTLPSDEKVSGVPPILTHEPTESTPASAKESTPRVEPPMLSLDDEGPNQEETAKNAAESTQGRDVPRATIEPVQEQNPESQLADMEEASSQPTQWTCDVCQEATFESYDDAIAHEEECRLANENHEVAAASAIESTSRVESPVLHSYDDERPNQKKTAKKAAEQTQRREASSANSQHSSTQAVGSGKTKEQNLEQFEDPAGDSSQPTWTCDVCQEATFEIYDEAVAHEEECRLANKKHAELSPSNKEEARERTDVEASNPRNIDASIEQSERPTSKSIHSGSESLSVTERNLATQSRKEKSPTTLDPHPASRDNQVDTSWTCDVCKVATFEVYDDAVAHERTCIGQTITQVSDELENEVSQQRADASPIDETEKPIITKKRTSSSSTRAIESSVNASRVLGPNADGQPAFQPARAVHANTHTEPAARVENEVMAKTAHNIDEQQPTPVHFRGQADDSSPPFFSPLSLTSPLHANNLMESSYHQNYQGVQGASTLQKGHDSSALSQLNGTPSGLLVHATKPGHETRLPNPSTPSSVSNGVASHNASQNLAFLAGEPVGESLQMVLAEKQYEERMTSFGRLEMEAKRVTKRMREIEDRIKSNGFNIEARESRSRKRSHHSESQTLSLEKSHSWSRHYESSEEEYSDEYRSPRKRRRIHDSSDEMDSRMIAGKKSRRRSDSYEKSVKRVKVSSRSNHREGSRRSHPNRRSRDHDDLEMDLERSQRSNRHSNYDDESDMSLERSQRSTNFDRHRADRYSSPERYNNRGLHSHRLPGKKKRSKGEKVPAFSDERVSRKHRSSWKQNSPKPGGDSATPRKPAARQYESEMSSEHFDEEDSYQHSGNQPSKPRKKSKSKSNSKRSSGKTDVEPTSASADKKASDTASSTRQLPEGGKTNGDITSQNNTNNSDGAGSADHKNGQKKDPLYWLAGGENSSDDESWDFDGPMILPPPPI